MIPKSLGIIGVGTIGGSIGLRARRNGIYVAGYDIDSSALEEARNAGAIDAGADRDEVVRHAEVLVLAAHLGPTLCEIESLRAQTEAMPALIVDVASVKAPVVAVARGLEHFVATHPMAGSERSGVSAARADLFEGRPWAYVPTGDSQLDARASDFIVSMGGLSVAMSADEHDRVVAITSHVPQMVAYCYAKVLHEERDAERLCGPVARELLRIAKIRPAMWRDIFAANSANIERDLRRLCAELQAAADDLAASTKFSD